MLPHEGVVVSAYHSVVLSFMVTVCALLHMELLPCFLVMDTVDSQGRMQSLVSLRTRTWPLSVCVSRRLTGYGIHHCFARSMMGHEVKVPLLENFYADYYTVASIALASCLAMCVVVRFLGRRGGLLLFMILTALASLLQLGLLNREWGWGSGTG